MHAYAYMYIHFLGKGNHVYATFTYIFNTYIQPENNRHVGRKLHLFLTSFYSHEKKIIKMKCYIEKNENQIVVKTAEKVEMDESSGHTNNKNNNNNDNNNNKTATTTKQQQQQQQQQQRQQLRKS